MFHIVYKTVNKINGKFYYGVHSTNNLNDDYLGSGININRAIKKYGREAFERQNLCIFNDRDEAFLYEKNIITLEDLISDTCYNIAPGGNAPPPRTGVINQKCLLVGDERTEAQKRASTEHSKRMMGRAPVTKKSVEVFGRRFEAVTEAMAYFSINYRQYRILKESGIEFSTPEQLKAYVWQQRNEKISKARRLQETERRNIE